MQTNPIRYIVTAPVEGGNQRWQVADTENAENPNFEMASFWNVPGAEEMARAYCVQMNERDRIYKLALASQIEFDEMRRRYEACKEGR